MRPNKKYIFPAYIRNPLNALDFENVRQVVPQAEDSDMLIGSQFTKNKPIKRILSKVYNLFIGMLFRLKVNDDFSFELSKEANYRNIDPNFERPFIDAELLEGGKTKGMYRPVLVSLYRENSISYFIV